MACAFPFSCWSFFCSSASPSYFLRFRFRRLQKTKYSTVIKVLFIHTLTGVFMSTENFLFVIPYKPLHNILYTKPKPKPNYKILPMLFLIGCLWWLYVNIFPEYWYLNKCALRYKSSESMEHVNMSYFQALAPLPRTDGARR